MMVILITLLVIAAVFVIAKNNLNKSADKEKPEPTVEAVFPSWHKTPVSFQRKQDGAIVIKSDEKNLLTLLGASEDAAKAIVEICNSNDSYGTEEKAVRDILLVNAIQVAEINSFLGRVRPIIEKRVEKLISEDEEWDALGEMDKKDKRMEYIKQSMVSFNPNEITPSLEWSLSRLVMSSPKQVQFLDDIIQQYGASNINTYCEYVGRKNPIISISNSDYRKPLENLVKAGLAYTGKDMSIEELLSTLTLAQLNEIAGAETRFTRKDKAIKIIAEKEDVHDIVENNIALRSLYALKPLPPQYQTFDFEGYKELLSYYGDLADVIVSVCNGLSTISPFIKFE